MIKKSIFSILLILLILMVSFNVMAEEITLKFMGWEASPLETESVKNGLELFMERNPNIKVEYTPVGGDDYHTKLLTMMAGNAAPDVFFLNPEGYYRDFQKRDVLLNIDDYFYETLTLDDFIPLERKKMVVDGSIYGVSSCVVGPVLFYNKEAFDEADLPYPPTDPEKAWSWEEFIEVAKELTIIENERTSQFGVYGFENMHPKEATIYSNNGTFFNEDYTKTTFDENAQEAMKKILELRTVHNVSPEANFLEQSGMSAAQMLQTERVAMIVDGSWALQELSSMDFPVGVGVLPVLEKPITTGTAHLHSIWKNTEYPDEAWKLVKFLSSEEYQIGLVSEGLWMPNRTSLYTDEGIDRWLNEDVHPEGFRELAPYFNQYIVAHPALFVPREAWDILVEEFDRFFLDNQPIEEVAQSARDRIDSILYD